MKGFQRDVNGLPPRLSFSGYHLNRQGTAAKLWFPQGPATPPGQPEPAMAVRLRTPDGSESTVPLQRKGPYWVAPDPVPVGTRYQVLADERALPPEVTETEVVDGETFNVVSPRASRLTAHTGEPVLHVFPNAALSPKELADYRAKADRLNDPSLPAEERARLLGEVLVHPYNPMRSDPAGLVGQIGWAARHGFRQVLFNPLTGESPQGVTTHHGYWTSNPYQLNPRLGGEQGFEDLMKACLAHGVRPIFDVALSSLSLASPPLQSLLQDGTQSPFWNWFLWDRKPLHPGEFPPQADGRSKFSLGLLPSESTPDGSRRVKRDTFDVRIVNSPLDAKTYQPTDPTYVELVPKVPEGDDRPLLDSRDSVFPYRFPVHPEHVVAKDKALKQRRKDLDKALEALSHQSLSAPEKAAESQRLLDEFDADRKRILTEWPRLTLNRSTMDGLPKKWDGQINLALANMANPETRDYLLGAMPYWTRRVQTMYRDEVGRALAAAMRAEPDAPPQRWVEAITRPANAPVGEGQGVLPPVRHGEADQLTPEEEARFSSGQRPALLARLKTTTPAPLALAQALTQEVPLSALPLPLWFHRVLLAPDFQKALTAPPKAGRLPAPATFQKVLADRLNEAVADSPRLSAALSYRPVQEQVMDRLHEKLFLHLLTGQTSTDPKAVEAGLRKTVPISLLQMNPLSASRALPVWMTERLRQMKPETLRQWVAAEQPESLDPVALTLADSVLNRRELGLHWRLDAAKALTDWNAVLYQQQDPDRVALFESTMEKVQGYWQQAVDAVHRVFPNARVVAELTDFDKLSHDRTASQRVLKRFFHQGPFDSMLNYDGVFSRLKALVHAPPEPHRLANAIAPSNFLKRLVRQSTDLPPSAVMSLFNMTATHDSSTTAQSLLLNPAIAHADQLPWRGLRDELREVCTELTERACFAPLRESLAQAGIQNLSETLGKLQSYAQEAIQQDMERQNVRPSAIQPARDVFRFSKEVMHAFTADSKSAPFIRQGETIDRLVENTPDLRRQLILDLFDRSHLEGPLGLPPESLKALKAALLSRVSEPSEVRAIRGVLNNSLSTLQDWTRERPEQFQGLADALKVPPGQVSGQLEAFSNDLFQAFEQAKGEFGQHLGYQPLDLVLSHVSRRLPAHWQPALPTLREAITEVAMGPVYDKLLRIMATQQVIPGTPVLYAPDLAAQLGGELEHNRFNQGRYPIRHDWMTEPGGRKGYFERLTPLLSLRERFPALKDGQLIVPLSDDVLTGPLHRHDVQDFNREGVLPIIRDNGRQQVIALVNTGQPTITGRLEEPVSYWDMMGQQPENRNRPASQYPHPDATQPVKRGYVPDLTDARLPVGTRYRLAHQDGRNLDNGPVYVVAWNDQQCKVLVREDQTRRDAAGQPFADPKAAKAGIDIGVLTVLERV